MNIVKYKYIFLSVSGILILASVVSVSVFGLKPGIDFVGGTLWQIKSTIDNQQLTTDNVRIFFENNLKTPGCSLKVASDF